MEGSQICGRPVRRGGAGGVPKTVSVVLCVFCGVAEVSAAAAQSPETLAYGAHLAASCAPCHQIASGYRTGNFSGSTAITGLSPKVFLERLRAKQDDPNPVMRQVASELGEAERTALAAYLATVDLR